MADEQLMKERAAQQAAAPESSTFVKFLNRLFPPPPVTTGPERIGGGVGSEFFPAAAYDFRTPTRESLESGISTTRATLAELEKKGLPTLPELASRRQADYQTNLRELYDYFPPVQRPPLQPESTLPVSAPRYTDVVKDRAQAYGAIARDSIVSALQGAGIQSGQPVGALTQMIAQAAIQGALGGARKSVGFTSEQLATTPTQESLPILRAKEQREFANEARAYQRKIQEENYQDQKKARAEQIKPIKSILLDRAGLTEEQLRAAATRGQNVTADTAYDKQVRAARTRLERFNNMWRLLPKLNEDME